jgi:hypothetical protein
VKLIAAIISLTLTNTPSPAFGRRMGRPRSPTVRTNTTNLRLKKSSLLAALLTERRKRSTSFIHACSSIRLETVSSAPAGCGNHSMRYKFLESRTSFKTPHSWMSIARPISARISVSFIRLRSNQTRHCFAAQTRSIPNRAFPFWSNLIWKNEKPCSNRSWRASPAC